MKINNLKNRGFSGLSVFVITIILASSLFLVSCAGSEKDNKTATGKEITKSIKDISETSTEFSGNVAQTTCLECHPAVKDGGFDIDFGKVKTSSVAHSKNVDVKKETTEESDKK